MNSCIHSDETAHSGGETVWYNYVTASAGTITNKNKTDTTGNIITATETICPKNWSLPNYKQINSNRTTSSYLPVLGGYYYNGSINNEDTNGRWWGSEAYNGGIRYSLVYNGSNLSTSSGYGRHDGFYIRCVSEEKTVVDLTYMQEYNVWYYKNNKIDFLIA